MGHIPGVSSIPTRNWSSGSASCRKTRRRRDRGAAGRHLHAADRHRPGHRHPSDRSCIPTTSTTGKIASLSSRTELRDAIDGNGLLTAGCTTPLDRTRRAERPSMFADSLSRVQCYTDKQCAATTASRSARSRSILVNARAPPAIVSVLATTRCAPRPDPDGRRGRNGEILRVFEIPVAGHRSSRP